VPLISIRLRPLKQGAKLVLIAAAQRSGVDLPAVGVLQLQAMLRQKAERAGWDVAAALARLSAAGLAESVVRKAQCH
jgi:hypothetical protein